MQINSLSTVGFRNLRSVRLKFSEGVNILSGKNGSGKTNILEAIHTLCLGRSQRGAGDQVMVCRDADLYRLEGELVTDREQLTVTAAYQRGGRKKLTIDGLTSRLAELYERFSVVSAGPEDNAVVAGSPSVRRTFLDIHLSQLSATYLSHLGDYQRALAQKNAALKAERDGEPFEEIMISSGSRIISERAGFVHDLSVRGGAFYQKLSSREQLSIEYRPSVPVEGDGSDIESIARNMQKKLEEQHHRERILQTSLVGPHRDEVYLGLDDLPARSHGSQGQWRSIAIALKLAVFHLLKQRRGTPPLLLLDEVFAELDESRSDALIDAFGELGQLFLTTAVQPPVSLIEKSCHFEVADGEVTRVN